MYTFTYMWAVCLSAVAIFSVDTAGHLPLPQNSIELVPDHAFGVGSFCRKAEPVDSVKGDLIRIHQAMNETLRKLRDDVEKYERAFAELGSVIRRLEEDMKEPSGPASYDFSLSEWVAYVCVVLFSIWAGVKFGQLR